MIKNVGTSDHKSWEIRYGRVVLIVCTLISFEVGYHVRGFKKENNSAARVLERLKENQSNAAREINDRFRKREESEEFEEQTEDLGEVVQRYRQE